MEILSILHDENEASGLINKLINITLQNLNYFQFLTWRSFADQIKYVRILANRLLPTYYFRLWSFE